MLGSGQPFADIDNVELDLLLPGIRINAGPDEFAPLRSMQPNKLVGGRWETFGNLIEAPCAP